MMKKRWLIFPALWLSISATCLAGVNLKNGNFYISYTDIVCVNSAMGLKIDRTYNSKIADIGWFGAGWGSEYETYLHTMPGGGAVIHWNGSGMRTFYKPAEWDTEQIGGAVDRIVELEQEAGKVTTPDEIMNLRDQLMNDLELRYAYWRRYLAKGKVQEYELKPGTKLYTFKGTLNKLTVTDNGFAGTYLTDSTRIIFDKMGKLLRLGDTDGNFLVLAYDSAGMIHSITDNDTNRLTFTTDHHGRVLKIEDQGHRYASYEYDDNQNLTYSKDRSGNQYRHGYDSRSNMTSISYTDSTRMEMEYDRKSYLIKLKDREGRVTLYDYYNKSNLDYGTQITKIDPADSTTEKTLYWYTLEQNEIGMTWMHKISVVTNEVDTLMKIYNDRSLLDTLVHNDTVWIYGNSVRGDLEKVSNNKGYWMEPVKRDEGIGTITDPLGWLAFKYDAQEKPVSVLTSDGLEIPYPYPADDPALQAQISRIRSHIRILTYWQECSCYAGKWK